MPKVKAPLFSIDAHGTIGNSLTFTTGRRLRRAISVPTHAPTYTPAQLRHRFLYRLGIALWNGLDTAGRAPYLAAAVGRGVVPMNVFLREWLLLTPGLLFCLPCEEASGLVAQDIAPSHWHTRLYGPSWHPQGRHSSLAPDGVDDYAQLPSVTDLPLDTATPSIVWAMTHLPTPSGRHFFGRYDATPRGWLIYWGGANRMVFGTYNPGGISRLIAQDNTLVEDERAVWGISAAAGFGNWYKDGADITSAVDTHRVPVSPAFRPTLFSQAFTHTIFWQCYLEWLVVFDVELTAAQHLAIAHAFPPIV